jgi:hypothetical protein
VNILAYADDIIILSPSANGLQFLIDKVILMLKKNCLILNANKSSYIIFRCRKFMKFDFGQSINIDGVLMNLVTKCTYLGVVFTDDFKITEDIIRVNKAFIKQFYGMFSKFYFLNRDMLIFLFRTFCTSFYGSEIWYNGSGSKAEFGRCGVAYHRGIKKMLHLSSRECNHYACRVSLLPVFNHFINKKILSFLFSVLNSKSVCITPFIRYFRFDSFLIEFVNDIFLNAYGLINCMGNDLDALKARIDFIERNETCSHS